MSANSPNPLVPQGSLQQQQTGTAKSKVRVAVFSIIAVHAVLFLGVLMQGGCKKDETKETEIATGQPTVGSEAGTYHSNPNDLIATNSTGAGSVVTNPGAGAFGEPTAIGSPGVPVTPTVTTPTTTLPPTAITPGVDMGVGSVPPLGTSDPAPSVQQYTIAKGDNFYTIATKLRTTTKKIIEANPNVNPAKLQIGQKINVPVSAAPAVTASASIAPTTSAGPTTTITYEVKPGDTLYGIAKKNGTTTKAIKSANNLKTDRISVGQKLKVAAKASASAAVPEPVITTPTTVAPPVTATSSIPITPR